MAENRTETDKIKGEMKYACLLPKTLIQLLKVENFYLPLQIT